MLQAGGGGGEVSNVAARFLVGFGARDVQPPRAIGFHGQVLPLEGSGFAAAQAVASILAITQQVSPDTCAGFWARSRRRPLKSHIY